MLHTTAVAQQQIHKEEIPINENNSTLHNSQDDWDSILQDIDTLCAPEAPAPKKKTTGGKRSRKKHRNLILAIPISITVIALIVLAALLLPAITASANPIPEGVWAGGIALGGLSRKEAASTLEYAICKQDMVVILPAGELALKPEETGIQLNMDALLDAAGQAQPYEELALQPYLTLDETAIRSAIAPSIAETTGKYTPGSFTLEGEIPPLSEAGFDPDLPCPTLVVTLGTAGTTADADDLTAMVMDAFAEANFQVDARELLEVKTPELPDVQDLYAQAAVAPISAVMDSETKAVTPASYGLGFDLEDARKLLEAAAPGESVRIPMEYVTPETVSDDFLFPDILGFCQTPHSDNEDRTTNLNLACAALNGVVLQPGQTLSYNATLGMRTEEAGYKRAPAYSGTELVNTLGGGICQVSSTLYLCSLYAELETVERVSHGYPVNYMPVGLDATVSWGSPDLKIRNSYDTPVKILAEVRDGFVCVWIMGTETRDYYVRMGFGSADRFAKSRVVKYDRKTDELLSSEDHLLSSYLEEVTSVVGEIGPAQFYRYGMVRDRLIPEPSDETLEAAKRNIPPNTLAP